MADEEASRLRGRRARDGRDRSPSDPDGAPPLGLEPRPSRPRGHSPTAGAPAARSNRRSRVSPSGAATPSSSSRSEALNACPKLRDRPGRGLLCRLRARSASWAARSACCTRPAPTAPLQERADRPAADARGAGRLADRNGRAFEKTQLQAATDELTGLVNRRTASGTCARSIKAGSPLRRSPRRPRPLQAAQRHARPRGRRPGAAAVRPVALDAVPRPRPRLRWGGEEFILVFPELDRFAGRPRPRALAPAASPRRTPVSTARFTASFGVTDSNQSDAVEDAGADRRRPRSTPPRRPAATRSRTDGGLTRVSSDGSATSALPDHPWPRTAAGRTRMRLHEATVDDDPLPADTDLL